MSAAPFAPFGTVLTAMVTVFKADGSVDLDQTQKVARHLVDHGHDGLVVSGTTGESATTAIEEDGEILVAVKEAVGDRAKVVAGVGTNDTRDTLKLVHQANRLGADGLLLVTPYYSKPGQRGILEHFRTVAGQAEAPVMLYDVPGRTGSAIAFDTYVEALQVEQIVAVKEAVGDLQRGARLVDLGYHLYSGDDGLNLAWLAVGACGFVSVAGHVAGDLLRTLYDSFYAGDVQGARAAYLRMLPAIDAIMGVPNYGATTAKAALQLTGVIDNRAVRQPLSALDDDELGALKAGLAAAGLL